MFIFVSEVTESFLHFVPIRVECLFSCQIRCFGLSCVKPSTWSTRRRCRATEGYLRRTWSSWLRKLSAAPATILMTTGAWRWPGHSLTGLAPVRLPRDALSKHAAFKNSVQFICYHESFITLFRFVLFF